MRIVIGYLEQVGEYGICVVGQVHRVIGKVERREWDTLAELRWAAHGNDSLADWSACYAQTCALILELGNLQIGDKSFTMRWARFFANVLTLYRAITCASARPKSKPHAQTPTLTNCKRVGGHIWAIRCSQNFGKSTLGEYCVKSNTRSKVSVTLAIVCNLSTPP
jgi:hypothetical protein